MLHTGKTFIGNYMIDRLKGNHFGIYQKTLYSYKKINVVIGFDTAVKMIYAYIGNINFKSGF